jgi:hypothetical protein
MGALERKWARAGSQMTFQDAGRRIFRAIKWTAKWLFIAWVAMFIAFLPYRLWETYKLKAMCEDIKPGLPVSEVRDLVEKYGLNTRWVSKEPYSRSDGTLVWMVPTTSSIGQDRCVIVRDKAVVLSATVDLD